MLNTTIRIALSGATCCLAACFIFTFADPRISAATPSASATSSKSTESYSDRPGALDARGKLRGSGYGADSRSIEPDRGEQIVRTALTFRGSPYRFGGVSPKSGFDCSGFVQAMCAKWGIYLPRAARQQFSASVGKRVLPSELKAGDLVFFSDTYRHGTSHVGIYIGDGKMIHAATPAQGVIVSDLTEEYLRKHYCGAIRIDLTKLAPVAGERKATIMAGAAIDKVKALGNINTPKLGPLGLPLP